MKRIVRFLTAALAKTSAGRAYIDRLAQARFRTEVYCGLDYDERSRKVFYNAGHEEFCEDCDNNPCYDDLVELSVRVWSIFCSKPGCPEDLAPLLNAMAGADGWTFASERDRAAIYKRLKRVCKNLRASRENIVIVASSSTPLVQTIAEKLKPQSVIIGNPVIKTTYIDVRNKLVEPQTAFRKEYGDEFNDALQEFDWTCEKMRDGIFSTAHFKYNTRMLRLFDEAVDGKDIIIVGDERDIISDLLKYRCPNSITALLPFCTLY